MFTVTYLLIALLKGYITPSQLRNSWHSGSSADAIMLPACAFDNNDMRSLRWATELKIARINIGEM